MKNSEVVNSGNTSVQDTMKADTNQYIKTFEKIKTNQTNSLKKLGKVQLNVNETQ